MAPVPVQPAEGGYQTGLTQQMFTTTITTTTVTVVHSFGFSANWRPTKVDPEILALYKEYGFKDPGFYQGAYDANGMRHENGIYT